MFLVSMAFLVSSSVSFSAAGYEAHYIRTQKSMPPCSMVSSELVYGYEAGKKKALLVTPIGGKDPYNQTLVLDCSAAKSWKQLSRDALRDGIAIHVNYAFREYWQQRAIWKRHPGKAAPPGRSTHQEGLSVDIRYDGQVMRWMRKNACRYGFANDVKSEPWHWSFLGQKCKGR